jgi:hypothetical protein
MVIRIGGYWLDFGPFDFREDLDVVFAHYALKRHGFHGLKPKSVNENRCIGKQNDGVPVTVRHHSLDRQTKFYA